jgi:hypothetical protein
MSTIEIYRARIDPANVERLLEIRDAAVAEFREQVPELLQADLVRLDGDTWLDILTWSEPVDPQRIEQAAACTPTSAEMHSLMDEVLAHDSGELVRSSSEAWSSAR